MTTWARDPEALCRNLTQEISLDTKAKLDLWHERLGHSGTTIFRRMFFLLTCHNLVTTDGEKTHECVACIKGKYFKKPSEWTLPTELSPPLYRLHGDLCGPNNPPSGYFVIILS